MTAHPHNGSPARYTRRGFHRLVGTVGAGAALAPLLAACGEGTSIQEQVAGTPTATPGGSATGGSGGTESAARVLRFGVSGFTEEIAQVMPAGIWHFKERLEERTSGELSVEAIGGNSICTELDCIQKMVAGTLDGGLSATQNAAQTIPFLNVLDFPYLWPNEASLYHFYYSPQGDALVRDVMRRKFGVELLFGIGELRSIFLGSNYADVESVTSPDQLRGAKIRVTGSVLGRLALSEFGTEPIPLNWSETLQGLQSGVVDGMETSSLACAGFGMAEVVTHDVKAEFFPLCEMTYLSTDVLHGLSDDNQLAVLEAAYDTQRYIQEQVPVSLAEIAGVVPDPPEGSIYAEHGVTVDVLTPEQRQAFEELASPEFNPGPYEEWMRKTSELADGEDVYGGLYELAREIPADAAIADVTPRKWWEA